MPRVSIVVPVFNSVSHLGTFFDALAEALPADSEVLVVDDASTEPVLDAVPDLPRAGRVVRLRNERNLGVAGATNRGLAAATGDVIVQLNTDVVVAPTCLSEMIDVIQSRTGDVGIVARDSCIRRRASPRVREWRSACTPSAICSVIYRGIIRFAGGLARCRSLAARRSR